MWRNSENLSSLAFPPSNLCVTSLFGRQFFFLALRWQSPQTP